MGTLAGSTVMLLTIAWTGSLVVGRCDIDEKTNKAIDEQRDGSFSFTRQGVSVLNDIKPSIAAMLLTSLLYFVVQSADWYWGATLRTPQPRYVSKSVT